MYWSKKKIENTYPDTLKAKLQILIYKTMPIVQLVRKENINAEGFSARKSYTLYLYTACFTLFMIYDCDILSLLCCQIL